MKSKTSGFTLIELLIAISILSLLLLTGSLMYRTLSERWQTVLDDFDNAVFSAKGQQLLLNVLHGIYPSIIFDGKDKGGKPAFLFIAGPERLFSVTRNGLFDDKYPEVFRLTIQESNDGAKQLIYESKSLKNDALITIDQEVTFDNKVVLLDSIEAFSFSYYGWQTFSDKAKDGQERIAPQWYTDFSGIDGQLIPDKIAFDLTVDGKSLSAESMLDNDSLRYLTAYVGD